MQRAGAAPLSLPSGLGHEAAGVVAAVGPGVEGLARGVRVAYPSAGPGAYAQARVVPADRLVRLPEGIADEQAAAVLFKGLTAWYLLHRTHRIAPGDVVVAHSAAGGVGQVLAGWARSLQALVVGTVGNESKRQTALDAGCHAVFVRDSGSTLEDAVRTAAGGRKARVVYDAVGRDTFAQSLDALAPFGLMVSFGGASGPVPPVELGVLNAKGGLFVTRPSLFPHISARADLEEGSAALFAAILAKHVRPRIGAHMPLHEAAEAHRLLAAGQTKGAIVLAP